MGLKEKGVGTILAGATYLSLPKANIPPEIIDSVGDVKNIVSSVLEGANFGADFISYIAPAAPFLAPIALGVGVGISAADIALANVIESKVLRKSLGGISGAIVGSAVVGSTLGGAATVLGTLYALKKGLDLGKFGWKKMLNK